MRRNSTNYKLERAFLIIAVLAVALFAVPDINAVVDTDYTKGAHRGNSVKFVENTFDALSEAIADESYQFIEFDIQYTKDKKIIVFHDDDLFRFQKQFFKVENLTYEELSKISRYDVPLYEEIMDLAEGKKKINVEIKSQGKFEDDKEIIDFVISDARRRGILNNILLSSISADVVNYVKSEYPELPVGRIYLTTASTYFHTDRLTKKFYQQVEESGEDFIMMHGINLRNYDALMRLKPADKTLVFWRFDDQMYVIGDGW